MPSRIFAFTSIAVLTVTLNVFAKDAPTSEEQNPLAPCPAYLDSIHYSYSKVFGLRETILSLKPEMGSIEDERPGTVALLTKIHKDLTIEKKEALKAGPIPPDQVARIIDRVVDRLGSLKVRSPDPRLIVLIDDIIPSLLVQRSAAYRRPIKAVFNTVFSKIWELTIACFFDGERIRIGRSVSQLFPVEFERAKRDTDAVFQHKVWHRELDVAVERWDGTWHWIETKHWGPGMASLRNSKSEIVHQNVGQNESRYLLRENQIDLSIVFRFGMSDEELSYYQERTDFDHILFAFPDGLPGTLSERQ